MAHYADVYARIRHYAAEDVYHRAYSGIEITFFSFFVTAPAHDALGLQRIDLVTDARGNRRVLFQDPVHDFRIALALAPLDDRGPVRAG